MCDKGYAGREFADRVADFGTAVVRPARNTETHAVPHLAPIRQRIECVFRTCKDLLTLERHRAHPATSTRALQPD